jgi:hypothetical protein
MTKKKTAMNGHPVLERNGVTWGCERCGQSGSIDEMNRKSCLAHIAKIGRQVPPEEQLALWAAGESTCPNTDGECCPDFSCCRPSLQWPQERRTRFLSAAHGDREKMLMGSIGALISYAAGKKAYVTRGVPEDRE